MSTTFATLRTRVSTRTRRGSLTNFTAIVNEAFVEFLEESVRSHTYREQRQQVTVSFASGAYTASLPSGSATGFLDAVNQILVVQASRASGDQRVFPLTMKSFEWLDAHFPDRGRSGTVSSNPVFIARLGNTLHLQSPVSDSYTINLTTSHLPDPDATSNPIPVLDSALVAFASGQVYLGAEDHEQSVAQFNRAFSLRQAAEVDESADPAIVIQSERVALPSAVPGNRFNLGELQDTYPGDVL